MRWTFVPPARLPPIGNKIYEEARLVASRINHRKVVSATQPSLDESGANCRLDARRRRATDSTRTTRLSPSRAQPRRCTRACLEHLLDRHSLDPWRFVGDPRRRRCCRVSARRGRRLFGSHAPPSRGPSLGGAPNQYPAARPDGKGRPVEIGLRSAPIRGRWPPGRPRRPVREKLDVDGTVVLVRRRTGPPPLPG